MENIKTNHGAASVSVTQWTGTRKSTFDSCHAHFKWSDYAMLREMTKYLEDPSQALQASFSRSNVITAQLKNKSTTEMNFWSKQVC